MNTLNRYLCAATLVGFAAAGTAHALGPSQGLWWNPAEGGRGYVIARQGGTMVLSIYAYSANGTAEWYVGAGEYALGQVSFQSDVSSFSGGQCLGCAYTAPVGTDFGTVSIQFSDAEHGVLSYPGGSVPIEHYMFGYANKQDRLLGYWSFSAIIDNGNDDGPQTLGEWLLFNGHFTATDGTVYVTGVGFRDPAVTALGTYSEATDMYAIDVTLPDGTLHHYDLQGDDVLLSGLSSYGANSTSTSAVANRIEYYTPTPQGQPTTPASSFAPPLAFPQR